MTTPRRGRQSPRRPPRLSWSTVLAPDWILKNGRVVTVDAHFSTAEALAVKGDRIVAVGTDKDVRALAGQRTRVVDLQGRTVIPGLMDNHVHQVLMGLESPGMNVKAGIYGFDSIADIVGAIGAKVKTLPPGEWLETSLMYRGALKEMRFPNRWDLDGVSPNNPVYVFQSGKNIIINSYALRLTGVTKDTTDPTDPEGVIVRDPHSGELTGHFIAGAADMVRKILWEKMGLRPKMWDFLYYSHKDLVDGLQCVQRYYNSVGVTSVRDMGVSPDEIAAYQDARRGGLLTVRTNLVIGIPARYIAAKEIERYIEEYVGPKTGFGDEWLSLGGIKMVMVNDGYCALSEEKVRTLVSAANRNGWQMSIHTATGVVPETLELALDALEQADCQRPIAGRRFSLEHGVPTRDTRYLDRIKKLGLIIASNQLLTYFASARSAQMGGIMDQLGISKAQMGDGRDRAIAEWGNSFRDWLSRGIVVTGGTDNPAVYYDPERPLLGFYSAITQESLIGRLDEEQRMTREEALKAYTISNAYATFEEGVKGSLEPGKVADFAVLSDNPLTVDEPAIKDIKVLATIVGGRVVYTREDNDLDMQ